MIITSFIKQIAGLYFYNNMYLLIHLLHFKKYIYINIYIDKIHTLWVLRH